MGFASYFEDIRDRLEREVFAPVAKALSDDGPPHPGLRMLLGKCRSVLNETKELLELASDPTIDRLVVLRDELERARAEREQLAKENASIRSALEDERKQREQAQSKLNALLMSNRELGGAVDLDGDTARRRSPNRGGLTAE